MVKRTVKSAQTEELFTNESTSSGFNTADIPTLLQWLKKQPKDRDDTALYLVRLCFFDSGYGNHTLVTPEFRGRLSSRAVTYEALSDSIGGVESSESQLYLRVPAGSKGNFIVLKANNPLFIQTRLRWIGNDEPYIGVELNYEENPNPDSP